jgi:membrane protease YdiL (CAAX protease family)
LTNYFIRQPEFQFKPVSVVIFIVSAVVAWAINIFSYSLFPSQNLFPFVVRTIITVATNLALIYVSFRLLKENNIPSRALGLSISGKTVNNILRGILIGLFSVLIIAGLLYAFIPYHFVHGSMDTSQAVQAGLSYLVGNTLEELMFRGFLFILLSQLIGWQKSALITGLLFGLFHLQGIGFTMGGLKMVATTACFSLVFSFSFVLFRSLWIAIIVHAVSNLLLHTITGLDGGRNAIYEPVFEGNWPEGYDVGLIVTVLSAVILSGLLFLLILRSGKKIP